ncbi:MAG: hypothetical protein CME24_06140, partial [Gemmatimonadetes bacterium]|nr:hypothetical protein [Gemmatimonadota bacterium]
MILSLMVLAIVLSLSVGAGYLVTRPLRLGDAPATDRLFFSAAAGLGVISSLMAIIGALDAYNPIGFGFGAIFLIVGGGLGRSACIADLRVIGDGLRTAISASTTSKVLFGLILFHWGVLLFAAFSPVYGYDALDRHLSIAKEYVHAGGFIPLTHIWGGDFPNQGVMLYTLALVLGDDRLAQITNVFALTCGMLGVFVLARPLKSVPLRLGASLVVLSLPAVTQYVASPYIDVYVQVWILAAWLALGNYANRSHSNDLIAGGLFGGLAA